MSVTRCGVCEGWLLLALWAAAGLEARAQAPLQVRGDHAFPPFEFLDGGGQPAGFNVDMTRAVCGAMSMDCAIELGTWAEVRAQLERGEVDVLMGMYRTASRDRQVDFTVPHFLSSWAVFVRDGSDIGELADCAGREVLVQTGDRAHDYVLEQGLTDRVVARMDLTEVLRLLSEGTGDCAVLARVQGQQMARGLGLENVVTVGPPVLQTPYCMAVREGDAALLAKLNEGLALIKASGEYEQIHDHWFSPATPAPRIFPDTLRYLGVVVLALAVLAGVAFAWSWFLRREVNVKTAALRRELAERARAEAALRESEARFRAVFESSPLGIAIVRDRDSVCIDVNPGMVKMTGYAREELVGHSSEERGWMRVVYTHVPEADNVGNPPVNLDLIRRDGEKRIIISANAPMVIDGEACTVHSMVDATVFVRLQKELQHAQKMEAVGQLAGGVAHDLNNLLQAILGYAHLALEDLLPGDGTRSSVEEVVHASRRAESLVRQLLMFARRDVVNKVYLEADEVVGNLLRMLTRVLGEHVSLEVELRGQGAVVHADRGQLEQVLVNLCVNARDAMPDGGAIRITTRRATLGAAFCQEHPWAREGEFVLLKVADEGEGIPAEAQPHVYEPFFTTKEVGKGTGIGLSTVYGVVQRHEGLIHFESVPGGGTRFMVYLPLAERPAEPEPEPEAAAEPEDLGGSGTILVAEDDRLARTLAQRVLERAGYRVFTACDGQEAVALFEAEGQAFDLAVLDVVMPRLGGPAVRDALRAHLPGLPVLFVSGYSDTLLKQHCLGGEDQAAVLRKPYATEDLLRAVRRMLAQGD